MAKLAYAIDLGSIFERSAGSIPVRCTNTKSRFFVVLIKCEDNKMSQLDTYRNILLRKKDENAKLYQDLAKEQSKISPLQKKIISAKSAISRTSNQSTIKFKLNEIERSNKAISDVQKKVSDIQKKIAQKEKEKEIAHAEKNYRNEEIRVNKKQADEDKKECKILLDSHKNLNTEFNKMKHCKLRCDLISNN